jgi:hypothetical protein
MRASLGISSNTHGETSIKKSLNIAETFPLTTDYEFIKNKIKQLCEELESRAVN